MKQKKREEIRAKLKDPALMEALKAQDCYMCMKLHTPEYMRSMEFRVAHNQWDSIEEVIAILKNPKWSWARNFECKYLDVRIDMRDGGCIIQSNSSQHSKSRRISPRQLAWQYSEETPDPIPDSEAYSNYPLEPK